MVWVGCKFENQYNNKNKYNNKRATHDGHNFPSTGEGDRYLELKLDLRVGNIKYLKLQVKYELQPKYVLNGKTIRAISYFADFEYLEVKTNKIITEDFKGMKTAIYKLKKKMLLYKYPDINFREV